MKLLATVAAGFTVACAFSGATIAQVRTYGPAAPYLTTGRSVAVPHYVERDETTYQDAGAKSREVPSVDGAAPATPDRDAIAH
ncbi:hypothetical protein Msil_2815 [Methylocella silvestris BL2]|uniref:Uncharacterized protein n=1 Tax=Methylocella silvestris (strain DSM 15510 / CIP 108128 / LMG 27833 / NCIMB 13906 / BL2) TaxID=395965 RepID=B8ET91_METSB|nr:hypothetical protein [Methylocella silvestris]ACK51733.1 hypothetical protein Msil_2815 [Methylocella silvestris BL2]